MYCMLIKETQLYQSTSAIEICWSRSCLTSVLSVFERCYPQSFHQENVSCCRLATPAVSSFDSSHLTGGSLSENETITYFHLVPIVSKCARNNLKTLPFFTVFYFSILCGWNYVFQCGKIHTQQETTRTQYCSTVFEVQQLYPIYQSENSMMFVRITAGLDQCDLTVYMFVLFFPVNFSMNMAIKRQEWLITCFGLHQIPAVKTVTHHI